MLQRGFIDWEWYTDVNTTKLFLHFLLKVNYSKKKWQGNIINKGEFITSYEKLAVETGLSISKVRTALSKLVNTNYVIVESTTSFTKISIPKLNDFVLKTSQNQIDTANDIPFDKQVNKPLSNNSITNQSQITTTNTNNNKLKNRKKIFRDKVYLLSKFNSKVLDSFFNYWTELDAGKIKMRFEGEKWLKNEFKKSSVLESKEKLLTNR
ncbi:hypothetical protein [Tenacibaculum piscium]|uniref:hypothetical protein n=1 Tax=Tenacibaculum piscium TaxID=1458515 RepID=UPI001EFB8FF6|nr:hypothetical protein [Tenacibaculum piscium]MCG8182763.1 hypothetical protein [Tenacibaculum piscium]MCG8204155.1 hypothetical protein [Tenacibaculum piscium]